MACVILAFDQQEAVLQNHTESQQPEEERRKKRKLQKTGELYETTQACVTNMLSLCRASCMFSQICHAANTHFPMVIAQRTRHLSNAVG